eukprot:GHVP01062075.1.p1 GENE.GHVP01062075.1~~GHVP01062075.1.p1  ORF type:complete len:202 (+),score=29.11 GHVP01062075.1:40-606(+)
MQSKNEAKTGIAGAFLTLVNGGTSNLTTFENTEAPSPLSENFSANAPPGSARKHRDLSLKDFLSEVEPKINPAVYNRYTFIEQMWYMMHCYSKISGKHREFGSFELIQIPDIFSDLNKCSCLPQKVFMKFENEEATISFYFGDVEKDETDEDKTDADAENVCYLTTFNTKKDYDSRELAKLMERWINS